MNHDFIPTDLNDDVCDRCDRSYEDHFVERIGVYSEEDIYGTEYIDLSGYAPMKEEW